MQSINNNNNLNIIGHLGSKDRASIQITIKNATDQKITIPQGTEVAQIFFTKEVSALPVACSVNVHVGMFFCGNNIFIDFIFSALHDRTTRMTNGQLFDVATQYLRNNKEKVKYNPANPEEIDELIKVFLRNDFEEEINRIHDANIAADQDQQNDEPDGEAI